MTRDKEKEKEKERGAETTTNSAISETLFTKKGGDDLTFPKCWNKVLNF